MQLRMNFTVLVCIFGLLALLPTSSTSWNEPRARIESCSGCSLNRLTDVKKFIFEDVPHYDGVEFKSISGAVPELVLLDKNDAELERIKLAPLNRQQCNELLVEKGFTKSLSKKGQNEL